MPIKVTCSNCGGVLHAPDDAGGKRGRCPTCGNILPIPAAAGGGGGDLPDPPAGSGGQRPPSFADFAMGPNVGPPPGGAGDAGRAKASIPFSSSTSEPAPPQRAKAPAEATESRRPADPFARKGTPAPIPSAGSREAPSEGTVKAWKRSRGGLGWVQAGNFLLFIPAVLVPGYYLADAVVKATSAAEVKADLLPYKNPGYLGLAGLDSAAELPLLGVGVPLVLALLLHLLGRLGFAGAPKRSAVGGPAMLSAMAAMWAFVSLVAVALPPALLLFDPTVPVDHKIIGLITWDSYEGMIQRIGMFSGIAALAVGEFWFASAVGRVGSALADGKPAARSTRFMLLLGLVVIGLVGTGAIAPSSRFGLWAPSYESRVTAEEFTRYRGRNELRHNPVHEVGVETNDLVAGQWEKNVGPQFDLAGAYKPVIPAAACLLVGLLVWVMHVRMVGAARGAMAGWLDAHGGAA